MALAEKVVSSAAGLMDRIHEPILAANVTSVALLADSILLLTGHGRLWDFDVAAIDGHWGAVLLVIAGLLAFYAYAAPLLMAFAGIGIDLAKGGVTSGRLPLRSARHARLLGERRKTLSEAEAERDRQEANANLARLNAQLRESRGSFALVVAAAINLAVSPNAALRVVVTFLASNVATWPLLVLVAFIGLMSFWHGVVQGGYGHRAEFQQKEDERRLRNCYEDALPSSPYIPPAAPAPARGVQEGLMGPDDGIA